MKRKLSLLLCALLLVSLLTACGSSSDSAAPESMSSGSAAADDVIMDEMGWAADTGDSGTTVPTENTGGSAPLDQAKIIRTATLEMETQAFDDAVAALDRLVEELGGYCESRSIRQHSTYRSASFTVRVPAASFDAFLDQAGQAAHVTWQDESQENVGESYYDIEARLATQRTKQERLLALLEEAATMEDIIDLENALSETELQIEPLQRGGAGPHLPPAAGRRLLRRSAQRHRGPGGPGCRHCPQQGGTPDRRRGDCRRGPGPPPPEAAQEPAGAARRIGGQRRKSMIPSPSGLCRGRPAGLPTAEFIVFCYIFNKSFYTLWTNCAFDV